MIEPWVIYYLSIYSHLIIVLSLLGMSAFLAIIMFYEILPKFARIIALALMLLGLGLTIALPNEKTTLMLVGATEQDYTQYKQLQDNADKILKDLDLRNKNKHYK